jgi:hypothetical protein
MDNRMSIEKLMEFVVPVTESGCWIWIGSMQEDNERTSVERENAHPDEFFWEAHFGNIPTGLRVSHKCNVQCCVNPSHLCLKSAERRSSKLT